MWIFSPLGVPSLYAVMFVLVVILPVQGVSQYSAGGYAMEGFKNNSRAPGQRT